MAQVLAGLLCLTVWRCRNMCTTSKSEVCKVFLKRQRKPLQVQFSSDARAGQAGVPGSSVSSALSACKLCSQKPPFAPEFARGSYLLSFTLSVKFKRNQKETQSKARLGPSEFHLTSPRKSYPRVLLKHRPGSHAIQHKSSSAVQKGLPAP